MVEVRIINLETVIVISPSV